MSNLRNIVIACAVAQAACSVPADWQSKIDSLNAFFADDDTGALQTNGYPDIYLPVIGNGYTSQEKGVRSDNMFVSGVFNGETTSPSHRARIPAIFDITVDNSKTTGVLSDIEYGTYHRRGKLSDGSGWYELRWYAHRSLRNLYVLEVEAYAVGNATFTFTSKSDMSSVDFKFGTVQPVVRDGQVFGVLCGDTTIPETTSGPTEHVCVATGVRPTTLEVSSANNGTVHTFLTATRTSLEVDGASDVSEVAQNDYINGMKLAVAGNLHSSHVAGWADLWESGVEISGRPDVAKAINASLYAVLSSVRDDWAYGLAPGGLTNYYNGHSFWDTETWMYPPLLYLHPRISQSLIQYRFDRLEGARVKAASYSPPFSGTMFPWESAFSGVETCPTFAATGLREDHISGDISFAVWQEWCMRENKDWLRTIGYPILIGVADFWVSRSTYSEDSATGKRSAHINGVIPPDEYVDHVNDSVYTNFIAAQALRFAVQATEVLGESCVQCELYATLAEDLVILFDATLGIHPEYEGYPGNLVKQGDVVLLHYPLGMEMSPEVQRADLEYYSERTDHGGPAMTWGMHSVGFLDLRDFGNAAKYFNMSFQDNLHAPLQVWTETPDGNACNFITGAGGFLQTVIAGYPGMRLTYGELSLSPVCPEGASYMKVRHFDYLGSAYDFEFWCTGNEAGSASAVSMYPTTVSLTLKKATGSVAVFVGEDGVQHKLKVGVAVRLSVSSKKAGDKPATFLLRAKK